jgi:hypothetical protein
VYRLSNSSVADVARYVAPRVPDSEKGLFMREISLLPILLAFEVNRRIGHTISTSLNPTIVREVQNVRCWSS